MLKHFKLEELVDKQTYENLGVAAWSLFNPKLLCALDDFHDFFSLLAGSKTSVIINNWMWGGQFQFRGYRPPSYQPGVTPGSAHRKGMGIDCDIKGFTAEQARRAIVANQKSSLLSHINRMEDNVSWVHFDIMPVPEGKERIYLFKV